MIGGRASQPSIVPSRVAGFNYLRKREQTLEKCMLKGSTLASCLGR